MTKLYEILDAMVTSLDGKYVKPAGGIPKADLAFSQVKEYASQTDFPVTGSIETIYIAKDVNKQYRWDTASSTYVAFSSGGGLPDYTGATSVSPSASSDTVLATLEKSVHSNITVNKIQRLDVDNIQGGVTCTIA